MKINVEKIKEYIKSRNMTQLEFAEKCGISNEKKISHVLQRGTCYKKTLREIARGMSVSEADLIAE